MLHALSISNPVAALIVFGAGVLGWMLLKPVFIAGRPTRVSSIEDEKKLAP